MMRNSIVIMLVDLLGKFCYNENIKQLNNKQNKEK